MPSSETDATDVEVDGKVGESQNEKDCQRQLKAPFEPCCLLFSETKTR